MELSLIKARVNLMNTEMILGLTLKEGLIL